MTQHADETTGAWLVLGGSKEPSSTMSFDDSSKGASSVAAVPGGARRSPGEAAPPGGRELPIEHAELTTAECVAVAAALTAWRPEAGCSLQHALAVAVADLGVPACAVERWLTAVGEHDACGQADTSPGRRSRGEHLLTRFGRDLRLAALAADRRAEAELLVAAVRLLREHLGLRERFDAALADARLEAVRQLAYGAGHEINNPLANIATRGQSLLRDEPDPQRRRKLATIVDQAFRARDMIGGLMVFAKPPVARPARVDLAALVESVIGSLGERPGGEGLTLRSDVPADAVWGWVDPKLVAEALHAVILNAIEAAQQAGTVTVSLAASSEDGLQAILVKDDGPGIDREDLPVVFDPFHCGREAGRGLGVGLSHAWALARACGGRMELVSGSEQGTSVRLVLPAEQPGEVTGPAKNPLAET